METIRAFISVDLPRRIQRNIKKIQNSLPGFEGKITDPENLHLTLKFLGEVDGKKIEEIKKRLRDVNFEKFDTEIDRVGVFSPKFVKIVWVHLSKCNKLQRIVDESLSGIFKKEERFMSHLTISRVKFLKNKNYFLGELKKIKIPKIKFIVDKFRLKKSILTPEGPVYETLEEYN